MGRRRAPVARQRAGEVLARLSIAAALGLPVKHHDDGSADGMYDLRVGPSHAPAVAIEVVGAVNSDYVRTWNAGMGRGPVSTSGRSNWLMFLADGTVAERLRRKLDGVVRRVEQAGWHRRGSGELLRWMGDDWLVQDLNCMGIVALYCTCEHGSGVVHLAQQGDGGAPDHAGASLPTWISEFLSRSEMSDVLRKLERSAAPQRHVYVDVGFKGAPFAVWNYLVGPIERVPVEVPSLPAVVDQVWLATRFTTPARSAQGVRWDGSSWSTFACVPATTDPTHNIHDSAW